MSATANGSNYLNSSTFEFKKLDENFQSYILWLFIFVLLFVIIGYIIYMTRLKSSETSYINTLYPSVDGNIRAVSSNDPDCSGNLFDYYIKTAYNSCSGGSYKNDFVSIDVLKSIIKQGVRGLDFELYSIDNIPVVATSTSDDYYVKETYNYVTFSDVMSTIQNYAFSGGTCPNPTDPLIIHLRIKSNNQNVYSKLADIFKSYDSIMLGKEYSFENSGKNLGSYPLLTFQNKVIIIVDRINNAFLENQSFLEYVNMTSNSVFARVYNYTNVKNNPDINELTEYNKRGITIVLPDTGINPPNPSGFLCRASGCQLVAMRYQYVDNYLLENALFFDKTGYAFALKPLALRYQVVSIPVPTPQNPDYSYETRNVSTDYYNFNF
jgi:hypothetical protein